MIPTTDPRTTAIPQGARHVRPVQPLPQPKPHEVLTPRTDHVAHLSKMVEYLRALQEHCGADRRVNDLVRDAAGRLQALVHVLSTATGVDPAHRPTPSTRPTLPPSLGELETAFIRWLADPVTSDEVRLDGGHGPLLPMRPVLDAVSASTRPLSGEAAATLGMPAGTTIGHAASELRLAVDDPAGPRCRSYRAAAYYLRGLDRIALATTGVERALP
jgi:hypothetical protein